MPPDEDERAAQLLERLLSDSAFRERFRAEPEAVCAEYGLAHLAPELTGPRGALEPLEVRESRSSLAGALLAAAGEGASALDSVHGLHGQGAFSGDAGGAADGQALPPPTGGAGAADLTETPPSGGGGAAGAADSTPAGDAGSAAGGSAADNPNPGAGSTAPAPEPSGTPPPVVPPNQSAVVQAVLDHSPHSPGPGSTVPLLRAVDQTPASDHAAGVADAAGAVPDASGVLPDPSDAYPGDGASQQAIAAWMGRQAHKAGLPAELPVMASLVESGLKNDHYGDADSVGFFQMRLSIWNHGPWAGYENKPELQLRWFIDHAVAVRQERIQGGDVGYGHDQQAWGSWVADIERPAEQYRDRYGLQLGHAKELLVGSGGTGPAAAGAAAGVADAGVEVVQVGAAAPTAVAVAERYLGTPYHWGGASPQTGFDCSGLAQYAYAQQGVHLPRVAVDQFHVGVPVTREQLEPGDLVFFQDSTGYVHHEGIYLGGGRFLHAPHTGDVVKVSSLSEPYYAEQFAGGRRVAELAPDQHPAADIHPAAEPPPAQQSGVFAALGADESKVSPPRSTVQFLPAVEQSPSEPEPGGPPGPNT
jgi:cell wall-associated NlpC family hydrolase